MNKKIQNNLGFIVLLLLIVVYGCLWFSKYGGDSICGDGRYYYEYFVRIFIDHNLLGSGLIKYPVGTMILELPFLAIALLFCTLNGIDLEGGYNIYFQKAVFYAALFYLILTLIILYKFLKRRFSKIAVIIACICLFWGTMIPVYICEFPSGSHIYGLFVCMVFFVFVNYYEENYDEKKRSVKLVLNFSLGAFLGLAAINRNTDVIIGASYLLYGINSFEELKARMKRVFSAKIFVQIFGFVCVYAIQMLLWYQMTGKWILYSYGGETFAYKYNPQVFDVIFSDGKGLFIYCPILFVGIVSMVVFRKSNPKYWLSQWIIFAGVTYFTAAWWCWWLGDGYGERLHCDVLVIFAIPLTAFFDNLISYRKSLSPDSAMGRSISIICYGLTVSFVVLNMTWISATRMGLLNRNIGTWYELQNSAFELLIK